jgi:beta-galactosidase
MNLIKETSLRRSWLLAAAFIASSFWQTQTTLAAAANRYAPPASPRASYSFNPNWKFIRQDVPGAENPDFDDSAWTTVSLPHTYNDVDSFSVIISHSGGDRGAWSGITWYRKHFKLPAAAKGGKVFVEFEGMKQAGHFWVNGKPAGKFENGVSACGLDLTDLVNYDGDNVFAAKVDNSNNYREETTGQTYQWMGRDFDPNYGGLNHDAWLHLTGKVYQTLPLLENLDTTGVYIYPSHFSIPAKSCDVTVEAQVKNESQARQNITLSAVVVDADGVARAKLPGDSSDLPAGQTAVIKATGPLAAARFWDVADPYLYDVYSILTVNGTVVDVCKTHTGFRQAEFKGGAGTGGLWLNGHFEYLKGFAERAVNEWAGLGQAYPDWMHDFNAQLIRSTHGNYMRWMHISPQMVDVRACDKAGIVEVCPAGDKERDVTGPQWNQRIEVMRDSMIYFRNNPSIVFWEAGNTSVTPDQMQEVVALRKELDPMGGRAMGARDGNADSPAITPIAEYFGVMMPQDRRLDTVTSPSAIFRGYSLDRRDRAPVLEFEDLRDEVGRRFWDDFSPPHFGFKKGPQDTWNYNQETFCLQAAQRYNDYWINRISNPDPAHARWSGYASIYWSDENADGRQDSSEVCRVSGKVDAVRLPKEAYYLYRVMQSTAPDIHIIGHWTYPTNTVKTMYVAANNCQSVELFVNGKSHGVNSAPERGYIFAFPQIAFEPGVIKAVAMADGKAVAQDEIQTAGEPKAIKLTPHKGPNGFQADGSDVVFFDVEVVDAQGRRCPTDEARVDFKLDGPAIWRGGYNSGIPHSVNNLYLLTEDGINRVSIRSTLKPGAITLTATREGLAPATVEVQSNPVTIQDGLIGMAP